MFFNKTTLLLIHLLLYGLLLPVTAQHTDPGISWYESFFEERQQRSFEVALEQTNAKLEMAIGSNDLEAQTKARKELGLIHLTYMNNYQLAMDFFIQSLTIEDSLSLRQEQVFTYIAMAKVFEDVGDYPKSAESLEQALEANRPSGNISILVYLLNKLGKINGALGKMETALENFELVLEYKEQLEYPIAEAEALFNRAHIYTAQGKYNEALEDHKQALAIWRSIRDKEREAQSLNDIGELYRLMKNDEKALANHVVALDIRQSLNDQAGIAESYNNIGVLYYQQQNYERAIDNLQLGLAAARDSQDQNQERKSYDFISQCYKQLDDFKNALSFKESFVAINDLIETEKREQNLQETQNRYVISKKESQIEKLESIRSLREKEINEQKKFRNFLFAIIGLAVVIAILVLYLYMVKRRSNKVLQEAHAKVNQQNVELQDLNAMKDKFFSIISHDLKGPLNSLTSFSGLLINHTDSLSKEEIRMLAQDLDKSLKNLFALLQNLLEWSRSQTGNIDFKPEVFDLGMLLEENRELLNTQTQNKKINIQNLNKNKIFVSAHKHSVNTVIRNLISNAIKFTEEGGTITLNVKQNHDKVTVSVADTGVGMRADVTKKLFRIDTKHSTAGTANEKGTGLGLILCKEFVEKNGGSIWVESEEGRGSVFYFTLPYSPVPAPAKM